MTRRTRSAPAEPPLEPSPETEEPDPRAAVPSDGASLLEFTRALRQQVRLRIEGRHIRAVRDEPSLDRQISALIRDRDPEANRFLMTYLEVLAAYGRVGVPPPDGVEPIVRDDEAFDLTTPHLRRGNPARARRYCVLAPRAFAAGATTPEAFVLFVRREGVRLRLDKARVVLRQIAEARTRVRSLVRDSVSFVEGDRARTKKKVRSGETLDEFDADLRKSLEDEAVEVAMLRRGAERESVKEAEDVRRAAIILEVRARLRSPSP
jgi:hypothetical protein